MIRINAHVLNLYISMSISETFDPFERTKKFLDPSKAHLLRGKAPMGLGIQERCHVCFAAFARYFDVAFGLAGRKMHFLS